MIYLADNTPLGEPPSSVPRKWWVLATLEKPSRIIVFCSLTNANGIVSDPTDDEFKTARSRHDDEVMGWTAGDRVSIIEPLPEGDEA